MTKNFIAASIVSIGLFSLSYGQTCYGFIYPGTSEIPGQYNGCTACTSDIKHGDGSCNSPVKPGGFGNYCTTAPVEDSYMVREKKPSAQFCAWCEEKSTPYTYTGVTEGAWCKGVVEPEEPEDPEK